ncbi:MAG: universal stress protein [Alphaproteobacteria bacterium]
MIKADVDSSRRSVFLVVVDDTDEMKIALRFACQRARRSNGSVALLYVLEPAEFEHWMAVKQLMEEERREEAEQVLHKWSGMVNELTGTMPQLYIREGKRTDTLLKIINDEPHLAALVLGASTKSEGPGPLVSHIVGKMSGRLKIPIIVVPGGLSDDEVDTLT